MTSWGLVVRGISVVITGNVGAGDRVASSVTGSLAHLMALGIGEDGMDIANNRRARDSLEP